MQVYKTPLACALDVDFCTRDNQISSSGAHVLIGIPDLQFFHAGSQSSRLRHGASARAQLGTLVAVVYVSRREHS